MDDFPCRVPRPNPCPSSLGNSDGEEEGREVVTSRGALIEQIPAWKVVSISGIINQILERSDHANINFIH